MTKFTPSKDMNSLLELMAYLRSPQGCPWDQEQTLESLIPHTIEEGYEVADAVKSGDANKICEELGDLLLQIVFYSQIAKEKSLFAFEDVVHSISSKLIRRHPHIFGQESANTADDVIDLWQRVKASEGESVQSPLPALLALQKSVAKTEVSLDVDPLLKGIIDAAKEANNQKRCLESEIKQLSTKKSL